MIWNSSPTEVVSDKNKNTDFKPTTKSLGWQPLKPGEVLTDEDIIPLIDLEDVETIALNRPAAYSRGSMIQIGETVYPNLGFTHRS